MVVIAHKLQTVRNADKIIVVRDGRVLETGTHPELLDKKGLYASYWQTQQATRGWKVSTNPRS